jgi:NAD(P)-dependent dehydrogenase (short-subunit alcohol dehydrogenase family)
LRNQKLKKSKMKILLIGANGTIGKMLKPAFTKKHEVITAGRTSGNIQVDISSVSSIKQMFEQVKGIDACVCVAGDSYTGNLLTLTENELNVGIRNKLLGQANLVLIGQNYLSDNGSFTLTSGKTGDKPAKNTAGKAMANGGINSFALAASLELQRGIRINVVSPSKVSDIAETDLFNAYLKCIDSNINGEIIRINY